MRGILHVSLCASVGALTLSLNGCAGDGQSGQPSLSGEDLRAIHAGMMLRTAEQCRAGQYSGPEAYYMVPPRYPKAAARRLAQGSVSVTFTVRRDGLPEDLRVVESNPAGVFDRAAVKAIKQWRFKPKCTEGKFVDASERYTLRINTSAE